MVNSFNSINANILDKAEQKLENNSENFYYSYNKLTVLLEELQENFSDVFSFSSIGKTFEDRDIWLVKISDNVLVDENEPEILYMGGMHGDEKPGYQVVIYTLRSIVENYTTPQLNYSTVNRIKNIVNNSELYFIPMVNPDGIEAGTRKNRKPNSGIFGRMICKGVDINRNFGIGWEEYDKHPFKYIFDSFPPKLCSIRYPFLDFFSIFTHKGAYQGPYPFSENETKSIRDFIEEHNVTLSVDYHTRGERIIYPWSYTRDPPPDESLYLSIANNVSKINGFNITQGSQWYYIFGSYKDWAYQNYSVLTFSLELCDSNGLNAPDDKEYILDICKTHLLVNIYFAEQSSNLLNL